MKFTVTLFLLLPALLIGKQDRPNFVIFLTDDMGWGDLACYGHPEIKTPNLDKFAKQGTKFTQAYSACGCLLYTSPSPRDQRGSRMPSSA